jgi:hypothetical protein
MEKNLNASITFLRERKVMSIDSENKDILNFEMRESDKKELENNQLMSPNNLPQTKYVRDYLIRKLYTEEDFIEVRCAVVGKDFNYFFTYLKIYVNR